MPQQFGGSHTEEKLEKLEAYLNAFTTVLQYKPFRLVYFDAFAGTPDINMGVADGPLLEAEDARPLLEGSSRRALKFGARFAKYVFVDRRKGNVRELEDLKTEYPELADRIEIRHSDANTELRSFCSNWPRSQRAVVFLDPFGNQVAWNTIEVIAATKAIDLWYLFPAGLGVYRQIGKSGVDKSHIASLDFLLGTPEWRSAFIETRATTDLFGPKTEQIRIGTPESITKFMIQRMKNIFQGGVLDEWLPLGSDGRHSYSLLFACANPDPKANQLALRLARGVLRSKQRGRTK